MIKKRNFSEDYRKMLKENPEHFINEYMDVIINMTEEFFPGEISVIELNPNRPPRIFWDLMNNGIYTIKQLVTKTRGELTALYGFVDELDDIEEYLANMNLKLKEIDLSKIKI